MLHRSKREQPLRRRRVGVHHVPQAPRQRDPGPQPPPQHKGRRLVPRAQGLVPPGAAGPAAPRVVQRQHRQGVHNHARERHCWGAGADEHIAAEQQEEPRQSKVLPVTFDECAPLHSHRRREH